MLEKLVFGATFCLLSTTACVVVSIGRHGTDPCVNAVALRQQFHSAFLCGAANCV